MGHEAKCDICGKKYWQDSSALAKFTGAANVEKDWEDSLFGYGLKLVRAGTKAVSGKKNICPDCMRAQAFAGGNANATVTNTASNANAKLAEAQANAIKQQQKMAAEAAFAESMSNLTFSGDSEKVVKDFEIAYQYWLKTDLKKDQEKIVAEKVELGLMALKKADSTKGEFYEQKVLSEKKKRKTIKIVKIAGTAIVIIVLFIMIGLAN